MPSPTRAWTRRSTSAWGRRIEDLDDVTRRRDGETILLAVGGRVFAVLGPDLLEVALDPPVAAAALRTPDTRPSPRGTGWIAFTPRVAGPVRP